MPLRAESSPPPGSVLLRRMQSSRPGKPAATQLRSTLLRLLLPALHPLTVAATAAALCQLPVTLSKRTGKELKEEWEKERQDESRIEIQ